MSSGTISYSSFNRCEPTYNDKTPTVLKQGPEGQMDWPKGSNPGNYNTKDGWG